MMKKVDYKAYYSKSIDFETYLKNMEAEIGLGIVNDHSQYVPQNLQRVKRIGKTIKLHPEIVAAAEGLKQKIHWLVITEHWCGDAAQLVPIMNAIAEKSSGNIDFRLIYRDENPDLIAAHMTNGTLSIPILLQLDENFELLKSWGPRPQSCVDYVEELKKVPNYQVDIKEKLQKWYADDKGNAAQNELLTLL